MRADPGIRIAIVGDRGTSARQVGLETVAQELGARLVAAGLDVTVFYPESRRNPAQATERGRRPLGRITSFAADARALARVAHGFDLVYLFGHRAALFSLLPRLYGTPVWIRMDDAACQWSRHTLWQRFLEWTALRVAKVIVVATESGLDELRERHRRLPPAWVIPHGAELVDYADPEPLAAWELAPGCYYLVVCRIAPENHVREIIDGFLAAHSTFPLVIVGDMEPETRYVTQVRNFSGARVRFIGRVDDRVQLRTLRSHARAYLHGHSRADDGVSLLEALGCGNVIIAHDNACNREVAGDTARYFRTPFDLPAAVAWAEELEGAERRACVAAAKERVRARYSWERVIARYLSALEPLGPRLP